MRTGRRWLGLLGPFGSVAAIVGAVVATRRSGAGVGGYLSELGAFGERGADAFRLGLAAGAVSCIAVAAALTARRPWRDSRVVGLLAAAGLVATQTIVRCTTGCPLPIADGLVPIEDTAHFVIAAAQWSRFLNLRTEN